MEPTYCEQCGVPLSGNRTCEDDFHQMLFWENDTPELGQVHHLMVLCYYLQHPALYSEEGLAAAMRLLVDFVEVGLSPQAVRSRDRSKVDSGKRQWNIKGERAIPGRYRLPVAWTVRAGDVVAAGKAAYLVSVQNWAESILEVLKSSGNLQNNSPG